MKKKKKRTGQKVFLSVFYLDKGKRKLEVINYGKNKYI